MDKGQAGEPVQITQAEVEAKLVPEPGHKPLLSWAAARRVLVDIAGEAATFHTVRPCLCSLATSCSRGTGACGSLRPSIAQLQRSGSHSQLAGLVARAAYVRARQQATHCCCLHGAAAWAMVAGLVGHSARDIACRLAGGVCKLCHPDHS